MRIWLLIRLKTGTTILELNHKGLFIQMDFAARRR